jgi:quinoprotein dehydrogenase-associated probable ABC transporter substrate-binding protein
MFSATSLGHAIRNILLGGVGVFYASICVGQQSHELRVCADPNNLPYSNQQQQGFENRIADLIGKDLHEPVTYVWFRQGEKFFKQTLNAGVCDVVMGVPTGFDEAATTEPYYRSTYVFLSRSDRHLHLTGFDDPRLHTLRIGVHILGGDDDAVPPVHAFSSRGIVRNVVGFNIFGRLDEANPAADLIKAVADGEVDVAVAWGPLAGYFAHKSAVPLDVAPIIGDPTLPNLPFHFDIALGVREGDHKLQRQLNEELTQRRREIQKILNSYGIPQVDMDEPATAKKDDSAFLSHRVAGAYAKGD